MAISNWRVPLSFSFLRCVGLACSSGLESLRNPRADNRKCGSLNVIRPSAGAVAGRWLGVIASNPDAPTRRGGDDRAMTWCRLDGRIPSGILLFNLAVTFVN